MNLLPKIGIDNPRSYQLFNARVPLGKEGIGRLTHAYVIPNQLSIELL
jgi:hypothetical protein